MQQIASKTFNYLRGCSQTIMPIGGLRKSKRQTTQPSNI